MRFHANVQVLVRTENGTEISQMYETTYFEAPTEQDAISLADRIIDGALAAAQVSSPTEKK